MRTLAVAIVIVGAALLACKKKSSSSTAGASTAATPAAPAKPAAPPLPPTPTQTFKLNDTAVLDGLTVTLEEYKECRLDNFYSRRSLKKKKQKLVGALAMMEGNGEKDHTVSTGDFKVTDPEGLTYRASYRSGTNCNPTLKSGRLAKGEKSKGWVLFEVPETAANLKITMTNRRPFRLNTPSAEREQKVSFDPGT